MKAQFIFLPFGSRQNYKCGLLILFVCQAILLSGCTATLWESERFTRMHWPANPPNVRLFYSESARDVLAEYDEASEGTTAIKRRAYWLERNAIKVFAERKPAFVSVTNLQDVAAVPVADTPASPPTATYQGLYAVVSTNGQSFTLYPGTKDPTVYRLPMYYTSSGQRVNQVLLTPFAVAVDATLVGGVLAIVLAYVAAAGGWEDLHYVSGRQGR
jgi:hypothetical protein